MEKEANIGLQIDITKHVQTRRKIKMPLDQEEPNLDQAKKIIEGNQKKHAWNVIPVISRFNFFVL